MPLEKEIQEWLVGLARSGSISSVIRYGRDPLSQKIETVTKDLLQQSKGSQLRHRSVSEACRVLQSLIEPRLITADANIAVTPGTTLRPDLLLQDEIGGASIIVELKRSRAAEREFATELLAYADALVARHPAMPVFFIIVSTSWAPLTQHAISAIAKRNYPILPLEYQESVAGELSPTLLVRADLLPVVNTSPCPPEALIAYTKTFLLPAQWLSIAGFSPWMNRIGHALSGLVREADKEGASGFVIAWYHPHEGGGQFWKDNEVRLYVSMCVRNAHRTGSPSMFSDVYDDAAVRALGTLEIADGVQSYSAEHEGTWSELQSRLTKEGFSVACFNSFGEMGDQVSEWRTQKRYALSGAIADTTLLPPWHPITWLPAVESMIEPTEVVEDLEAWQAYTRGRDLGQLLSPYFADCSDPRHFGWTVAQTRFAIAWCTYFASRPGAPAIGLYRIRTMIHCNREDVERACDFAAHEIRKEGDLPFCCFLLGYHIASGCNNEWLIIDLRSSLREQGIHLPSNLNQMIDELEQRLSRPSFFNGSFGGTAHQVHGSRF